MCFARIPFTCTKKLCNLLAEAIIIVLNVLPSVRCAVVLLTNKKFRFLWDLTKGFIFLKRYKNHSKMFMDMYIAQHAQTKSVFTFQPTQILVFPAVKSPKSVLTCLIFLFGSKTDNYVVRWWWYTLIGRKRGVISKKKNFLFFKKIICRAKSSTFEFALEKGKSTLSVYSKATWLPPSPTTVLISLSTLDWI